MRVLLTVVLGYLEGTSLHTTFITEVLKVENEGVAASVTKRTREIRQEFAMPSEYVSNCQNVMSVSHCVLP
jgi:hypothetical protein